MFLSGLCKHRCRSTGKAEAAVGSSLGVPMVAPGLTWSGLSATPPFLAQARSHIFF